MQNENPLKRALWSAGAVLAVALSVFGIAAANRKAYPSYASAAAANATSSDIATVASAPRSAEAENEDEAEDGGAIPRKPAPATGTAVSAAASYKDGTYEAVGTYDSPGGSDSLDVTLTIKNGIVTASSVTPMPNDRTSARYQDVFLSGYKSQVIGKPLATLNLDYVSGSSLTPIGFDSAVAAIKAKAKS